MSNLQKYHVSKNMFSSVWEQGTIDGTGADAISDSCVRTKGYISVENGKTYSFKRTVFSGYINLRFYDLNKQYIGGGANNIILIAGSSEANPMGKDLNFCCFTINNSDIAYMRINDFSNDLTNQYMMCEGQYTSQTMPSYEPYSSELWHDLAPQQYINGEFVDNTNIPEKYSGGSWD